MLTGSSEKPWLFHCSQNSFRSALLPSPSILVVMAAQNNRYLKEQGSDASQHSVETVVSSVETVETSMGIYAYDSFFGDSTASTTDTPSSSVRGTELDLGTPDQHRGPTGASSVVAGLPPQVEEDESDGFPESEGPEVESFWAAVPNYPWDDSTIRWLPRDTDEEVENADDDDDDDDDDEIETQRYDMDMEDQAESGSAEKLGAELMHGAVLLDHLASMAPLQPPSEGGEPEDSARMGSEGGEPQAEDSSRMGSEPPSEGGEPEDSSRTGSEVYDAFSPNDGPPSQDGGQMDGQTLSQDSHDPLTQDTIPLGAAGAGTTDDEPMGLELESLPESEDFDAWFARQAETHEHADLPLSDFDMIGRLLRSGDLPLAWCALRTQRNFQFGHVEELVDRTRRGFNHSSSMPHSHTARKRRFAEMNIELFEPRRQLTQKSMSAPPAFDTQLFRCEDCAWVSMIHISDLPTQISQGTRCESCGAFKLRQWTW